MHLILSETMPAVEAGPIEGVCVLGGGTAFPSLVLSNEEVLRAVSGRPMAEDELRFVAAGIEETTGLRSRAWAHRVGAPFDHASEETTLSLAVRAAREALTSARVDARELSLIAVATSTPHRMTATVSAALGAALGANAACVDTRAGCASGIFGLATASLYLGAGSGPALLVGTETFSKVIPPGNRMAALSLGDGAGALVLGRRDGARLEGACFESDGKLGHIITTDGALPPTEAEIARGGYLLSGAPDELAEVVPGKYLTAIKASLKRARIEAAGIDLFVPHQTSRELITKLCAAAGIPVDRTFLNVSKHANVGAAGWIIALVEARPAPGTKVLVAAVGGGMSWGAAVLTC
jgi:acetoacetyl-CoA synthase